MELEVGEFFVGGEGTEDVSFSLLDSTSNWKSGIIIHGVEVRPRS
ncbi:hypothetical protein AMTRI_Chr07g24690 [Amborella trichopoda]